MSPAFQQHEPDGSFRTPLPAGVPEGRQAAAASHLAHDARNWLTVLQVYCDLLRTSGAVAGNGRKWIEELSNAIERGQGLVTSLLDSAHTLGSQQPSPQQAGVPPKPLDLGDAIQRRLPLFRKMAGSRVQVEARTVPQAETTALQELELDRILLNLVGNAIDAMPDGGRLTIELGRGSSSERSSLVLKVSDTGKGMAADILSHIFDSGFSTKPTLGDAKSERGFGLAIVRELALGAGGSVRVRSRIGHGTCFTIELPLLSPSGPADPDTRASQTRKLAAVSQMPQPKPGRAGKFDDFGANRKGTRVPC
ncbi:MAG: HAMP domain-containing sensor histidine kinase [Acidobacteriaceae bacterium]